MSTCKKWREEIGSFYENFKNDQTMPEYWKNHTVSYKITMSVYSLFLARKFSNESLHSPAHYHFLICDLSSCADDIHIKLIQYLCTNSKTYKMIFTESELLVAVFWRIQRGFKESQLQHLESLPGESVRFDGEGGRAGDTRTTPTLRWDRMAQDIVFH